MDSGIPKTLLDNLTLEVFLVVILIFYKDPLKYQQVVSEPPLLLDYWELKFFFVIV